MYAIHVHTVSVCIEESHNNALLSVIIAVNCVIRFEKSRGEVVTLKPSHIECVYLHKYMYMYIHTHGTCTTSTEQQYYHAQAMNVCTCWAFVTEADNTL